MLNKEKDHFPEKMTLQDELAALSQEAVYPYLHDELHFFRSDAQMFRPGILGDGIYAPSFDLEKFKLAAERVLEQRQQTQ